MSATREAFLLTLQKASGQIMHLSMRGLQEYVRREGLSMPQMFALRHVYYKGACNVSELSERLSVTHAASSQMLDRLVQQGLILRSEDPQDRRNKQIILTEKGRRMLRESTQASQRWLRTLATSLTVEEMGKISEAFDILLKKLSQMTEI